MKLTMLLNYGAFALPLAMVALPIYVYLPQFYAERVGLPLAAIGALLLVARMAAAFIDPLLGWWIARGQGAYGRFIGLALAPLLLGFIGLFHPPALTPYAALGWFLATLMLLYAGLGVASIAHQSWGAALTQAPRERARVAGVREACGLAGVLLAASVTGAAGYGALSMTFAAALALSAALLLRAPRPTLGTPAAVSDMALPFRQPRFRSLFAVLMVGGVASAIPATLFLFFTSDHLRLAPYASLFLMLYFGVAGLSIPLWVALAARVGEARAWAGAMLLASLVFIWSFWLAPGAAIGFGTICALSGLALGADLALPPALLAGVIKAAGHAGAGEATYFGVWNWGVQMTLALAAGISLPLLAWCGYVPGTDAAALSVAYALLPCGLKLLAAAVLWRARLNDI